MGFRERVLELLVGPDRIPYLLTLASHFTLRARGEYVEAGQNEEAQALASLRAANEVMIVIVKQLRSSMAGQPDYPEDVFVRILLEKSAIGGREGVARDAIVNAIREFDGKWP